MDEKFKFTIPTFLEKSEDSEEVRIWGLASTPKRDLQGEVIKLDGMDLSPIEKGRGVINWDHKKDPKYIIGALDKYKKSNEGLYLGGYLFKNHDQAKAVQQIMTSLKKSDRGRLGMSVEGVIKRREGKDQKTISKAVITAVALTMNPINEDTYVNLSKAQELDMNLFKSAAEVEFSDGPSQSFSEEPQTKPEEKITFTVDQVCSLIKSLGVGAAYATSTPAQLTGGDALASEDLDKDEDQKKRKGKKSLKNMDKEMIKSTIKELLDQLRVLYPEASTSEIWEAVKDRLNRRFV